MGWNWKHHANVWNTGNSYLQRDITSDSTFRTKTIDQFATFEKFIFETQTSPVVRFFVQRSRTLHLALASRSFLFDDLVWPASPVLASGHGAIPPVFFWKMLPTIYKFNVSKDAWLDFKVRIYRSKAEARDCMLILFHPVSTSHPKCLNGFTRSHPGFSKKTIELMKQNNEESKTTPIDHR